MSIKHLSFRDLQCVVAVAEHQSFSRGAEACAITQPALSERIKRIESILNVELFERTKRTLTVTSVGEQLVRKARELLDDAEGIDTIVSASTEPLTGPLRVGIIATLGPYLMPLVLPELRNKHPNLELILHEGLTAQLITKLQAGSLDIVIAAAPLNEPTIKQTELFDEPFYLAAPIGHRLAERPEVYASDLHGDEMVLLDDGHCLSGQALDVCPKKQRQNQNRLHAMSLETLRHMVAAGAGYSLMPSLAIGSQPQLSQLISYRKLGGNQQYGRKVVMAWRQSYAGATDARLLAGLIRACIPEHC